MHCPLYLVYTHAVLGVGLATEYEVVDESEAVLKLSVVILEGSVEIDGASVLVSTEAGTATPGTHTLVHSYSHSTMLTAVGHF